MAALNRSIVIFPIANSAFGIRTDWFQTFAPKMLHPVYLLIPLLLVISVGIMVLKRFENIELEKKLWNLPLLFAALAFWPTFVLALKELVDAFNTFLIVDVFHIPWRGFGFPAMASAGQVLAAPAEGLARLLPNLAYWTIYAFYLVFFFFYSVLGPFSLIKGILSDEVEGFLDLVKELVNLLFWQTTLVFLVALIMPSIVSGMPLPAHPPANIYFLSVILGIAIVFVPTLTRKFQGHIHGSFVPLGLRWGGAGLAIIAAQKLGGRAAAIAGASPAALEAGASVKHGVDVLSDFRERYSRRNEMHELKDQREDLEFELREKHADEKAARREFEQETDENREERKESLTELSRKAQEEMEESER